ncbi:hypothetical protein SBA4_680018 [Candidatus Sulfopaludibacter sp. SbA4]|nr:hypothetical protein SBA4_680018 [Candidatus Sulfopaludibacter sp. SbA4]
MDRHGAARRVRLATPEALGLGGAALAFSTPNRSSIYDLNICITGGDLSMFNFRHRGDLFRVWLL